MDNDLLRIGIFSTLSRISVRMLRHYQNYGVLLPAYIDPYSRHRYYRAEQLEQAHLVAQLRDAGFSVEKIAHLVASADPTVVEAAIDMHRAELFRHRDALHAQLAALDRISTTMKGHPEMTDVTRTTIPEMVIAGLRKIVPTYHDEGTLWEEIMPALTEAGVSFPAEGLAGATFHDREYQETDTDIEVWVQVSEPFNAKAPLTCRVEPTQEVVTARLLGDYSQMPAVTTAIGEYLAEHQVTTGSMFNIYRVSPAQNPDPSSWVTDVCFPIADE